MYSINNLCIGAVMSVITMLTSCGSKTNELVEVPVNKDSIALEKANEVKNEILKNIIANLVYLCKNYIHGDFSLSKMSKYPYYKKWCH